MKILIVERNELTAESLRSLLKDFNIEIVNNNSDALCELEKEKFDILLLSSNIADIENILQFVKFIYTEKISPYMKIIVAVDDKRGMIEQDLRGVIEQNLVQALLGVGASVVLPKFPLRKVTEKIKNIAANIEISA